MSKNKPSPKGVSSAKKKTPVAKKAPRKPARRKRKAIHFTYDQVRAEIARKAPSPALEPKPVQKVLALDEPAVKTFHAAATLADILGFNPKAITAPSPDADVPDKWKPFHSRLIALRDEQAGVLARTQDSVIGASFSDVSGGASTDDAADAGADEFERSTGLGVVEHQQNLLNEINAALERIRRGTYGICAVSGKLIPRERLLLLPYARCRVDSQRETESHGTRFSPAASVFPGGLRDFSAFANGDDDPDPA
jgi:RNA polymerase-binding transcription factor DksA